MSDLLHICRSFSFSRKSSCDSDLEPAVGAVNNEEFFLMNVSDERDENHGNRRAERLHFMVEAVEMFFTLLRKPFGIFMKSPSTFGFGKKQVPYGSNVTLGTYDNSKSWH